MKRILRKGNPIARLVALLVVFVMVLVPLLENVGPLKKVKAASPYNYEHAVVLSFGENRTIITDATGTYIEPNTAPANPKELHYYNSGQTINISVNTSPSGTMVYTDGASTAHNVDVTGNVEIQTVKLSSIPAGLLDSLNNDVSTEGNGYYIGIYAKLNDDAKATDGTELPDSAKWSLVDVYKVVRHTSFGVEGYWVDASGNVLKDCAVTNSTSLKMVDIEQVLMAEAPAGSEFIGDFEYYYADATGNTGRSQRQNYDESDVKKNDGTPVIMGNAKVFYAWADYVLTASGDNVYSTKSMSENGKKLTVDTVAPAVNTVQVQCGGASLPPVTGSETSDQADDIYYLDKNKLTAGSTYDIYVLLNNEVNPAESIEFYFETETGEKKTFDSNYHLTNTYKLTVLESILDNDVLYTMSFLPVDACNNGIDKAPICIGKIKFIDTSLKVTKTDGTDIEALAGTPTNTPYSVDVKISSGYPLSSVAVMNGDETIASEDLSSITKGEDQLYTKIYTVNLPSDTSSDFEANDLKIVVKDTRDPGNSGTPANEKTVQLGKLDYDITPPELSSATLSVSDGNSTPTNFDLTQGTAYIDADVPRNSIKTTIKIDEKHCSPVLNYSIKFGDTDITSLYSANADPNEANTYIADLSGLFTKTNKLYTISAVLEDSVGNKKDNGNYIVLGNVKIIDKDLQIKNATLTDGTSAPWPVVGLDEDPNEKAFKVSPSNKPHTLNVEVESGYELEQAIIKTSSETLQTIDLRNKWTFNDGIYSYTIEYTFPASADADKIFEDIEVIITDNKPMAGTDKNSVNLKLGDFTYDKTAPDLVALGIYKKVGDDTYVKINDSDLSNGEYIVDTTLDETFVVLYGIKDATSELKSWDYYFNNSKETLIAALNVPEAGSSLNNIDPNRDEYYIEYTTDKLVELVNSKNTNEVTFYAGAVDIADNATSLVPATYTLVVPDNQLEITEAKLTDMYGNVIDITQLGNGSYISNKGLELHVKAVSGYDITTMELLTGDTVYSTTTVTSSYDVNNKKYSVEQTLVIPTDISYNQLLQTIQLRVTDTGNPAKIISIGQLLYDMSAPTINTAEGNALPVDSTWYQSYNLAIAIKAGAQSVESELENVKYSISNSYGDKTDVSDGVNYSGAAANLTIDVPESYTSAGTTINVSATDKATNSSTAAAKIKVDKTNPTVDALTVNDNEYNSIPLPAIVVIKTTASDNLALAKVSMVVESEDGTKRYLQDFDYDAMAAVSDDGSRVIRDEEYALNLSDGKYNVTVTAYDKSGRVSSVRATSFIVDSTKPVVTAKVTDGTKGGKKPLTNFDGTARDYYYKSNVGVELTYADANIKEVVVTDNGNRVNLSWTYDSVTGKNVASYKSTADGLHTVVISATDLTGNEAESKTIYFTKDTVAPTISAIVNGAINYTDSTGSLIFTNDSTVAYSVSDSNEDKADFNYQMIKNVPDEPVSTGEYIKTAVRTFSYTEEADYTINVFSVDMASNKSETKTVSFRLDKTAPNISIGGIGDGGSSSTPVTVSLNMQELFWRDATGTVEIYMKSGEGFGEELIEEITYTPAGRNTTISRTFTESGIYRIVFNAQDRAGHTATTESAFTIDTDAPVVTLEGVTNFDVTDKDVVISSTITEKFYASKKVTITGSVTDETGKVTPITINDYSATANPTVINHTFSDDGIYDLTISCVDIVGNTDSKTVHFTIDKTKPIIGDLSDYDGKILTSFEWDKDLDELVSDLTVCDVHMYLNGQEYNGEDAVEDGSYVLLITAEDELGHVVEKSVEFVLDTKSPVFIVTGVEDKEKKLEPYNISVSLQLEEDTLTSVILNGKVVTITNNVATINVTDIGEYKLYMEAVDEAGNVSSAEYEFELISEKEFNFWIIIGIAALLLLIILFIILGKRKKG